MTDENIALVTGAADTIGAATAERLAQAGYRVVLADINLERAETQASGLKGSGHKAIRMNVLEQSSIVEGFTWVEREMGPIKALVSVVGGPITTAASGAGFEGLAVEDWDATYALNARSQFIVLQQMLKLRRTRPVVNSRCVTIASIVGEVAWSAVGAHYATSKAAVIALTKFVAHEAAPLGMTVNTVAPGAIDGPNFRSGVPEEIIASLVKATPIQRLGSAQEVAATVAWLLSEEAGYITGATIDINGGRRMG